MEYQEKNRPVTDKSVGFLIASPVLSNVSSRMIKSSDFYLNRTLFYTIKNLGDPYYRDRVVQLCPPANPYIKKSSEWILTYDQAGDYINKFCKYADRAWPWDNIGFTQNSSDSIIE